MMEVKIVKTKKRDYSGNYTTVVTEEYALKSCNFTLDGVDYLIAETHKTGEGYRDAKHRMVWKQDGKKKSATVTHQYLIDTFLKRQK